MRSQARLSAALLAPKGNALPLANAYANPHLDPLPPAGLSMTARTSMHIVRSRAAGRISCLVPHELLTKLRILSARRGKPVRVLVTEALRSYLAAQTASCACLRDGELRPDTACCGQGAEPAT